VLWSLGLLGWLGFRLNLFLNVMTPLVMVMGFADSMQMVSAIRIRLREGDNKTQAVRFAVRVVGPACVLAHATALLSFLALLISQSGLIRTFGLAGALAVCISFVAGILVLPLLGLILVRKEETLARDRSPADRLMDGLGDIVGWIVDRVVHWPALTTLVALVAFTICGWAYLQLEPRYRLADQVPDREQAVEASSRLDAKLTGANPIDVLIEFPKGASLYAPETLAAIGEVHSIIEEQAGVGNVWSLETLRRWLKEKAGITDVAVLKQYVDILPEHLTRRFISANEDSVVVSGRIPDIDASQLLPVINQLDKSLDKVREAHPGYSIAVTGLSAIAARNSASMIGKLNRALTVEIVFVAAFIGLAFRSFIVMCLSILPGIFPIVLSGTLLWAMGEGLQFAAVVALVVSFGLGLSATIHFLNRMRLEDRPGADPATAVERATVLVGPALILTSVVLACGLAVTVLSDLPSLRTFGWLSAFAMIAALVADLLILRPTAMFLFRLARRGRRQEVAEQAAE